MRRLRQAKPEHSEQNWHCSATIAQTGELLFARGPPEQGGRKRSSDLYRSCKGCSFQCLTHHGASRTRRAAVTQVGAVTLHAEPGAIGIAQHTWQQKGRRQKYRDITLSLSQFPHLLVDQRRTKLPLPPSPGTKLNILPALSPMPQLSEATICATGRHEQAKSYASPMASPPLGLAMLCQVVQALRCHGHRTAVLAPEPSAMDARIQEETSSLAGTRSALGH